MGVLIERIVRVNGEEVQRSTIVAEYDEIDGLGIPVLTIKPPLIVDAEVELELSFDPPLTVPQGDS